MHAILFSPPGAPVLYYGDEIGMGDNVYLGDRDGVRTPMQWTGDRNGGFSRADFAQLYLPPLMDPVYGYQAVNVEAQLRTPTSLLRWLHRFIALRKEHPVFGLGTYEPLRPENPRIFAHIRRYDDDIVLCVHNLARSAQAVELDLAEFEGWIPEEMLGRSAFPRIGELPYLLTLAPRGWFWFQLRKEPRDDAVRASASSELIEYIAAQRWYGSKGREVAHAAVVDCAELPGRPDRARRGALPRGDARDVPARRRRGARRPRRAGRSRASSSDLLARGRRRTRRPATGRSSSGRGRLGRRRHRARRVAADRAASSRTARSSSTRRLILKVYRRLEAGINPELEMLRFLDRARLRERRRRSAAGTRTAGRPIEATLGILQEFVPGALDGWELALDELAVAPGRVPRPAAPPRRGDRRDAHRARLRDGPIRASRREEPSPEALGLLTATIDEEIERVFLELPDDVEALEPIRHRGEDVRERLRQRTYAGAPRAR